MDYWDTSAVVKLFAPEPDSEQFAEFHKASRPLYISTITDIEVLCTLRRKEKLQNIPVGSAGRLYQRFLSDCALGHIVRVPYGDDVVRHAREVVRRALHGSKTVMVRSLDVIQIASALAINAKRIVAIDSRLREVASLNSLALLP
ncbi:MAG: type II toxin-antitoxin system VapC family toxin [Bryobacterales bacterium]|nr:type II toxin-antitoxin system VapC family toxin [Bryobacterales bacterium]MBV9401255.1 type II toxin-antitoxin system VapC family toxin [Bryobacterales bacterium]